MEERISGCTIYPKFTSAFAAKFCKHFTLTSSACAKAQICCGALGPALQLGELSASCSQPLPRGQQSSLLQAAGAGWLTAEALSGSPAPSARTSSAACMGQAPFRQVFPENCFGRTEYALLFQQGLCPVYF